MGAALPSTVARVSNLVFVLAFLTIGSLSLRAAQPNYLPGADISCQATLPDGTHYTAYGRILKTSYRGQTAYVDLRAYYKPGSGEFLWFGPAFSEKAYQTTVKDKPRSAEELCEPRYPHLLMLKDHEWVEFLPSGDKLQVLHCNLRFPTVALAWQYVGRYWDEAAYTFEHWSRWVPLSKDLGADFFRPENMKNSSEPFNYNFIVDAQKTADAWEVEIKSADGSRRALVRLNVNFQFLKVTPLPAAR
jgi:hypothetical protein